MATSSFSAFGVEDYRISKADDDRPRGPGVVGGATVGGFVGMQAGQRISARRSGSNVGAMRHQMVQNFTDLNDMDATRGTRPLGETLRGIGRNMRSAKGAVPGMARAVRVGRIAGAGGAAGGAALGYALKHRKGQS